MVRRWTQEEDTVIREWRGGARDLTAKLPGRAYTSVRSRMSQLGIRCRLKRPPMRWTPEEDEILRNWKGKLKDVLPMLPGREYTAVRARKVQLGVTRKKKKGSSALTTKEEEGEGACSNRGDI